MPVQNYGVLKAHPVERMQATPHSPHFQIHVVDQQTQENYRMAVNVLSNVRPYNLLYRIVDNFTYPTLPRLLQLEQTFTSRDQLLQADLAIDYLRSDIVDQSQLHPVYFMKIGSETHLNELLELRIQKALDDPDSLVFAFGDRWGPQANPDQYFGFTPGDGLHNIHMNQGNDPTHEEEDGVRQDGALLIYTPSNENWSAVFLKFQSQAMQTDDNGHAL